MTVSIVMGSGIRSLSRRKSKRRRIGYLLGAVCIVIALVMLLPLLAAILASIKPAAEAAAIPPTYLPHGLSADSYVNLWNYQAGLPTYLYNSFATAFLSIGLTLLIAVLWGLTYLITDILYTILDPRIRLTSP